MRADVKLLERVPLFEHQKLEVSGSLNQPSEFVLPNRKQVSAVKHPVHTNNEIILIKRKDNDKVVLAHVDMNQKTKPAFLLPNPSQNKNKITLISKVKDLAKAMPMHKFLSLKSRQ